MAGELPAFDNTIGNSSNNPLASARGRSPKIQISDVVFGSVEFDLRDPAERLIVDIMGTGVFQRLRNIRQTGNVSFVYPGAEHARFSHAVGSAFLMKKLLASLSERLPPETQQQIEAWRPALLIAAAAHDIGHRAPRSHLAERVLPLGNGRSHELIGVRIIEQDAEVRSLLDSFNTSLAAQVAGIIKEDSSIPHWVRQTVSGSCWNVDRGNWIVLDSVVTGLRKGFYDIQALLERFTITTDGRFAIQENGIPTLREFLLNRDSMYRDVYEHRVVLSADAVTLALTERARALSKDLSLTFCDSLMARALAGTPPEKLSLRDIYWMDESWWETHVKHWSEDRDAILSDLASRLRNRELFKLVRAPLDPGECEKLRLTIEAGALSAGYDPRYYCSIVQQRNIHRGDAAEPMTVLRHNGTTEPLDTVDGVCAALWESGARSNARWIAAPEEVVR